MPAPSNTTVVVIRPDLSMTGGKVTVLHRSSEGAEIPVASFPVRGAPDHEWPGLLDHVKKELASGRRHFLVDLDQVPWVNSRGLGRLIELWQTVKEADGRSVLICNTERVLTILQVSQLDRLFLPFADPDEALKTLLMKE